MEQHPNFMSTVKVGPKGQIVIPKEVRDMFDIKPGDSLIIMAAKDRGIALERESALRQMADAIFSGRTKQVTPEDTPEALQAFAQAVKETAEKADKR